jgi:hypothetical protein
VEIALRRLPVRIERHHIPKRDGSIGKPMNYQKFGVTFYY